MFSVYLDMCVLDFNYGMDRFGYHGDEYLLVTICILVYLGFLVYWLIRVKYIGYHGDEYLLVTLGYFLASVGYFSIILRLPWR